MSRVQVSTVRVLAGLFGAYFFFFYLQLLDLIYLFRDITEPNSLFLKAVLITLILISILFTFGKWVRLCALLMWAGYTYFYNFIICINQPHITYYLYILITFVFLSSPELTRRPGSLRIFNISPLWIPIGVYMIQMSISGFSKALSSEWQNGDVLRILSQISDPDPGVLFLGELPDSILRVLTWSVLILECGSFLYLIVPRTRFIIWTSHVLMYLGILVLIPHATHVAFVMLLFNILIFDPEIIPKRWRR